MIRVRFCRCLVINRNLALGTQTARYACGALMTPAMLQYAVVLWHAVVRSASRPAGACSQPRPGLALGKQWRGCRRRLVLPAIRQSGAAPRNPASDTHMEMVEATGANMLRPR